VFAGRTDRGVHAVGQVVSFPAVGPALTSERFQRAVNARLPTDLSVVGVRRRPVEFHARYDARWREYRYRIWCGSPQPLVSHLAWQRARGLDLPAMDAAAKVLLGRHDLATFAGGGEGVPWSPRRGRQRGTIRDVLRCSVRAVPPWWGVAPAGEAAGFEIRVAADGFLPRMVRAIVGALVEVGRGAQPVDWMAELVAATDRRAGPPTAPAHGLVLWRVGYDDEEPDSDDVGA
jgi:tRNA pseudouridine38-40 synthase